MLNILLKQLKQSKKENNDNPENYADKYQIKPLLTNHEAEQYAKMLPVAQKIRMTIFTKVRLADIIEPKHNQNKWKTFWYKIQSKHVDFILCNSSMSVLYVIEIDDASHDKNDRIKRDQFVDYILQDCGIKVLRYKSINVLQFESDISPLNRLSINN